MTYNLTAIIHRVKLEIVHVANIIMYVYESWKIAKTFLNWYNACFKLLYTN